MALPRIRHGHYDAFYITVFSMRQDMCCEVSIHPGDDERDNQVEATGDKNQVALGTTADEIISCVRLASCMWFMPNLTILFTSSHTSKSAAKNAVQAYNTLPTSSEGELFEALTRVNFHTTMIYKACHAGEFFKTHRRKQALLSGQDPNPLGVPCYSVEFGNPFPGREQGIAHRGVEVVYAFGTFHQALDKANRGVSMLLATRRLVGSVLNMPLEYVLFNTEILVFVSLDKGLELYPYLATSPWPSHVSEGIWPLFIHSSDEQASLKPKASTRSRSLASSRQVEGTDHRAAEDEIPIRVMTGLLSLS
ncbi:hypothetical protein E5D57_005716 [Metarhizium anisopliae]|nr:hypothetical protein E5D57_005716 [Metarhizium anisopliae]